jgi:thioesterase domain-containing protein
MAPIGWWVIRSAAWWRWRWPGFAARWGEPVATLALVDTIFDRRFWSTSIFLDAQLHRLGANLRTMAASSPTAALAQFRTRARGLWRVLAQRLPGAPPRARRGAGEASPAAALCEAAMSAYRPSPYPGVVNLFQSVVGRDFGCEPAALWRPLAGRLEVHAIPGRHLDLVRVPAVRAILAAALDAALAAPGADPV